jgi:hypothetical protein
MKTGRTVLSASLVACGLAALAAGCSASDTAPRGGTATGTGGSGYGGSGWGAGGSGYGGSTGAGGSGWGGSTGTSGGGYGGSTGVGGGGYGGSTGVGGGAGGGSAGTGGGTSGTVTPVDSTIATNGFETSLTWKGYCFTGKFPPTSATVQVSPLCGPLGTEPCFQTAGKQLCATGSVPADATFASGALLGCNVNQAESTSGATPVQTVATGGTGLDVKLSGNTAGLRVTITADESGTTQWCANVPAGGSGQIKWTDFNKTCWASTPAGAFTAGTSIAAVQITVPSSAAATSFGFCLVSIAQY